MKKQHFSVPAGMLAGACLCLLSVTGCKKNAIPETADSNTTGTAKIAAATNTSFSMLRGADVGFLTEMEKNGNTFFNTTDQQDLFTILKERNINAIRLRVWVNPAAPNYYNGIKDVVAKAVRAKNAGMQVLIDFHY
ncbi:MAG TPA: glycosyl hydrolase 53 family protein, partial [Niastella sp.]